VRGEMINVEELDKCLKELCMRCYNDGCSETFKTIEFAFNKAFEDGPRLVRSDEILEFIKELKEKTR
jgi:hypothetical protein